MWNQGRHWRFALALLGDSADVVSFNSVSNAARERWELVLVLQLCFLAILFLSLQRILEKGSAKLQGAWLVRVSWLRALPFDAKQTHRKSPQVSLVSFPRQKKRPDGDLVRPAAVLTSRSGLVRGLGWPGWDVQTRQTRQTRRHGLSRQTERRLRAV